MTEKSPPWTLERLVDFEQAVAASPATPPSVRGDVVAAIRGMDGAAARREGLGVWLAGMRAGTAARKFSSALSLVTTGLAAFTFLTGISAVIGLLDHERGGINVTLFLAILIGGQWLVLALATIAWLFRRRAAEGFSGVQAVAGKLARSIAGSRDDGWWRGLMDGGGAARAAVLWRLARVVQTAGVFFNIGIVCGLAGLVLVKHVGFFWETTTELAMRSGLESTAGFLSAPWSAWFPAASPSAAVIDASRWLPGRTTGLAPGPSAWWEFLLMVTLVWGLLPRAILWLLAWRAGRKALGTLDFQGRNHRALWREITGTERIDIDEKPLDGVLVLDVGGSGLTQTTLRPFLLRRLRVHPAAWKSIAVLDAGAEQEAIHALAKAPAGIVLLAEGWALSPARMTDLHRKIRISAGAEAPVKFLVANVDGNQQPIGPTNDECREWERFVDSLKDPAAEIYFYETPKPAL
ncbi:MAG: DUF2868 domain-containing protein [Luteolibacter sp.]|uniref:DUF2868 domain-containing protein n=1 Tax=Luteolibacter sp. TaxID=1962973 RepID=UPI003266E960